MSFKSKRFSAIISLVFLAALSRVIPHPYNFTPVAGLALFSAAYLGRNAFSFVVPLVAMLLSDAILGFHSSMWAVYGSFAVISVLGINFLDNVSVKKVFGLSIISSLLFFVITNFAVWYGSSFYPQNAQGLLTCYTAGLAFYQKSVFGNLFFNTVIGDLFYNGLLFGTYAFFQKRILKLATT